MTKKNIKRCRPFLKWAGNKYRIIDRIQRLLPEGRRLIEPFAGSGAVFLNTNFDRYVLSDSNADLINLYQHVKKEGPEFIKYCKRFFARNHNTPEVYYHRREEFNHTTDLRKKAALFLYLNRHGYNGLCRYNLKGGFNVPFGRYRQPYFPSEEMQQFHFKAKRAAFKHADFGRIMRTSRDGDVIYCDPPYVPLSRSANFTAYSKNSFNDTHQTELATLARDCRKRGIPVLISNHHTRFTLDVYQGAVVEDFVVRRYISCNGKNRNHAGELLALYKL